MTKKTVVVTGAGGFIGRNLVLRLVESGAYEVAGLMRATTSEETDAVLARADVVVHLAGVNRPPDPAEFETGNAGATRDLVGRLERLGRPTPILYASSSRATDPTRYGASKKAAEDELFAHAARSDAPVAVFRLPNVFGKWARPNYNSAVATFCHNLTRGLPIRIDDPAAALVLVYVDDVVDRFLDLMANGFETGFHDVPVVYRTTVGELADILRGFVADRSTAMIAAVGTGLTRALYATWVAALPPADFAYPLVTHTDPRGMFCEMLKTRDSGQFSVFTAHPGVTRGGHYHHTKTEKFLIVQGEALFRFRHVLTDEVHEVRTDAARPTVVETVPGWTHDVTNVGSDLLVAVLWANEIFDRARPDTIAAKV